MRLLTKAATDAIIRLFRPGFKHSKAEIFLLDLRQPGGVYERLVRGVATSGCRNVMEVLNEITQRWGRGTLRVGSVPANPDWGMRREMMSSSFTTNLMYLWAVEWN